MSSTQTPEKAPAALETESGGDSRVELSAETLEALAVDTPLLPPREPLGAKLAAYFGRHLLLLFWLSFGCLWAILSLPSPFNQPDFAPGQNAPRDYVAPQNAFLFDRAETERRQDAAAALVTPAYNPEPGAQSQALSLLREGIERTRAATGVLRTPADAASTPQSQLPSPEQKQFETRAGWLPPPELLPTLRDLQSKRWKVIEDSATDAVRAAYLKGRIRSDVGDDLNTLRPILRAAVAQSSVHLSPAEQEIALQMAILAAKFPNVVVNQKATDEAQQDARRSVLPRFLRVEANTPLVREGERVTSEQWDQLQQLGLISPQFRPLVALANGALCLLLVSGAAAYLARGRRELLQRPAALWLVAVVPVVFLAIFRGLLGVPHADFMMVPLAATAAMLLTVLIDTRVGLPAGFVVAALCALMARSEAGLFLAATLSAWVGALSVMQLSSRFALLRSVALLTVSNAILAASLGILRGAPADELLSSAAWSGIAGAGSVLAMAGLAIFLERPFGITSHLRLLELLAPDETVIRRMQLESPGTYTHSMTVAILSEAAAKSIGADPLLARVGGLYHDIGKLRRPHCFIENQSGDNVHDRLSPGLSALLIKAHVKDGLELGRAVRLPQPVLDIIASHHGQTTIAYFLHRARQIADGPVDETIFRYPGPKARSREAAIVMLADSIEASARSLPQITPESLKQHVQNLISVRLSEGELDDCDLSMREMATIRDSFVGVLRGVLHGRIAYPDPAALSGVLSESNDWVRETLGEISENSPKTEPKVATPAQKRQNKEKESRKRPQLNQTDASGTNIEGQSVPQDETGASIPTNPNSSNRPRRRRFKPPFHAPVPVNGTPRSRPASELPAPAPAPDQPQLEPRRASGRNGTPDEAPTQKNGANGHRRDSPNGAAALSEPRNAASNGQ